MDAVFTCRLVIDAFLPVILLHTCDAFSCCQVLHKTIYQKHWGGSSVGLMRNKILFLRKQSQTQVPWHTSHSSEQNRSCPLCLEIIKRKANGQSLTRSSWDNLWNRQLWLSFNAHFGCKHQTKLIWTASSLAAFPWNCQAIPSWGAKLGLLRMFATFSGLQWHTTRKMPKWS